MKHSHVHVAHKAFYAVLETMRKNDAAKGEAWLKQDFECHLAHAREHLHKLNQGDKGEDHIRHAATRIAMALFMMAPEPITFDVEDE